MFDIVDFYYKDAEVDTEESKQEKKVDSKDFSFYKEIMGELDVPFKVDLVVCNPPWIPASFVKETSPLDNGVYDPEEKFIKSALNYCKVHLSPSGEMLLIYSDLGY